MVLVTGLPGTGKSTIADAAARRLGAPVFAHDWAMSGLRPYPDLQATLEAMDPPGHRAVGWSIICALAQAQLRRGGPVVLDGVARATEIAQCQALADEERTLLLVMMTECEDADIHRSRVEERRRDIPNWYELDWSHVQRARDNWQPSDRADLVLDATISLGANIDRLSALLDQRLEHYQVVTALASTRTSDAHGTRQG